MTVPLPQLPTDNLYKFMAITGLVLLVLSPYFWVRFSLAEHEKLDATTKALFNYFPNIRYMDNLEATRQAGRWVSPTNTDPFESNRLVLLQAAGNDYQRAATEFEDLNRHAGLIAFACVAGAAIGLALCVSGFWLWYSRIQKHQDRILAIEAKAVTEPSHPPPPDAPN
jgi:hypothetical protein